MHLRSLSFASLCMFLSACASTPTSSPQQLAEIIRHAKIEVLPIQKPAKLAERTKAQAIGRMVVSSVVASAVGSSGNPQNFQQFQENVKLGQQIGADLSRSLPDSYKVEAGSGTDLALAKKISDFMLEKTRPTDSGRNLFIAVSAPLWEVGYISLLTSQDYALNYKIQVQVSEKTGDKTNVLKRFDCAASAPEKMPLEQWKMNEYAAVNKSASAIVEDCFTQFLTETGLH